MLNAKLKPVQSDDERSADRYRLLLQASVEGPQGELVDVVIQDLSASGFLIQSEAPLSIGSEIALEIPGLGVATGDIVWEFGRFFGGQFRTPIDEAAIRAVRNEGRVVWADFANKTAADRGEPVQPAPAEPVRAQAQIPADERWPLNRRLQFIAGASLLLWTPLALGVWVAVS